MAKPARLICPPGLSNVVAIAAGGNQNLSLQADGRVLAWGACDNGIRKVSAVVPQGLNTVEAIAAGESHCLALQADGRIIGWGINADGRADAPAGLSNVAAISPGSAYCLELVGSAGSQAVPGLIRSQSLVAS